MALSIDTIPLGTPIVDPKDGTVTVFFRRRWESLQQTGQVSAAQGAQSITTPQSVALPTTRVFTTRVEGLYVLWAYLRKTVAANGNSSLTLTWGWTDHGTPMSATEAPVTTDSTTTNASYVRCVWADANTDITVAIAYSSSPAGMQYIAGVAVQQLQVVTG